MKTLQPVYSTWVLWSRFAKYLSRNVTNTVSSFMLFIVKCTITEAVIANKNIGRQAPSNNATYVCRKSQVKKINENVRRHKIVQCRDYKCFKMQSLWKDQKIKMYLSLSWTGVRDNLAVHWIWRVNPWSRQPAPAAFRLNRKSKSKSNSDLIKCYQTHISARTQSPVVFIITE